MRLGIGSYTFGWAVDARKLSAMQIMDIASQHGIRVVQLCNNLPPETFDESRLEDLKRYADARGLAIELGTAGSQPEHLRTMIGVAKRLGSPILRNVVDSPGDKPSCEQVVARICEVMPELRSAGITLAIENHDRFPAESLAWIMEQCGRGGAGAEHVGICLDTVNSMGVPEGPRHVVAKLGPYTVNLHLKDFVIQRVPSMQGFTVEGRPSGEGMLDVPWLSGEMQRHGRDRSDFSAIIELWSTPLETMEKTIERENDWAMRSIANLRKWIKD